MSYIVYILKSRTVNKTYVGSTDNLGRRLKEHNSGMGYYTKRYAPWDVIYTEELESLIEARRREKYLKSASGRRLVIKRLFES